uniref:spermatogenesis-associated protein 17-like n=1 Tax=Styela clava TaxID=7725 RepID=UPI001939DB6D|nr:spermatogenesis-associated protein 17-like [Styela clava]
MAKFLRLLGKEKELVKDKYKSHEDAEANRIFEYNNAVVIQSWYRGLRVRHYLRHLQNCSIVIQRNWRGFMGRRFYRILVRNLVMVMRMNFYNCMATRIQKIWRGFYVREHVHNFYARKRYLEALAIKNQIVRNELDEYQEQLETDRKKRKHDELEKKLHYQARKHHYLLSTHQKPGIYNSPFWPYPHEMEFRLRAAQPLDHKQKTKQAQYKTSVSLDMIDPTDTTLKPHPPTKTLPPIRKEKIQGPFKDPVIVYRQRYRPLNPSLRVSTDFTSLHEGRELMKEEEWRDRVIDVPFLPFSTKEKPYEPLLHTSSKFGHLPYGVEYFRETNYNRNVSTKRMQTVVSPIPVFDKFEQTYSKGAVVLQ